MLLTIDSIREHPNNARQIPASQDADEMLIASMRTIGLLQPILVVADPDAEPAAWELRAGSRRLRAAKALGWTEIPAVEIETHNAIDDAPETAISAAENMVRSAMHPVDQWRAIRDLRAQSGYSLETAAAALGVSTTMARRMEWLSHMAPELLEAIGAGDLPHTGYLQVIAMASNEQQRDALVRGTVETPRGMIVDWRLVCEACQVRRIARTQAIFDPTLMAWDEDLFAQPHDEMRFTTADIDTFLQHQNVALAEMIAKSKGRMIAFKQEPGIYHVTLPKGWAQAYDAIPKRFLKDDPRRVFVTLSDRGGTYGGVLKYLASPVAQPTARAEQSEDHAAPARPAIRKKTLQQLATLKTEAVRSRLLELKDNGVSAMLEALLMIFTFRNVRAGTISGSPYGSIADMVGIDGVVRDDLSDTDLCAVAAWVISAAVSFDAPDNFASSGPGAEWLAATIGAEMPRTDTVDILSGINHDTLIEIATKHKISARGTAGAIRKRLVGNLPSWRAVQFGAPGPLPDDDEIDTSSASNVLTWPDEDAGEAA